MKAFNFLFVPTIFATVIITTPALAKKGREGLNFGTSVKVMDSSNSTTPIEGNDKNTRTKTSDQAFSPYLGYSFGEITIGGVFNVEQSSTELKENSTTSNQQMYRKTDTSTKAFSLFTRFNFGKVMFMEGGFGLYNQTTDVHTEYKLTNDGGTFSGKSEDYKLQGTGPGYHLGGGLELPINNGFYFSSAYMVRSFYLRDQSKGQIGAPMGTQQKREVTFGISYFD